jgi:hypothetical protein
MIYLAASAFTLISFALICDGEVRAAAAWMDRERRKRGRR